MVKPDVVFFGEDLPHRFYSLRHTDLAQCDLLLIMGTSLEVCVCVYCVCVCGALVCTCMYLYMYMCMCVQVMYVYTMCAGFYLGPSCQGPKGIPHQTIILHAMAIN